MPIDLKTEGLPKSRDALIVLQIGSKLCTTSLQWKKSPKRKYQNIITLLMTIKRALVTYHIPLNLNNTSFGRSVFETSMMESTAFATIGDIDTNPLKLLVLSAASPWRHTKSYHNKQIHKSIHNVDRPKFLIY